MRRSLLVLLFLVPLSACQFFRPAPPPQTDVDTTVLARAPTDQSSWITDRGSYYEQRYSSSGLVNEYNLADLELKWAVNLDGSSNQTPLTIDNTIYLAVPGRSVLAVDAETGATIWKVTAGQRVARAKRKQSNGGMAIWGGNLYVASSDGRLLAFDRRNGKLLWQSPVVEHESQFFTSPPRLIAGSIVVSVGGKGAEGSGYLAAYNADTGEQVWRYGARSLDAISGQPESLQFLAYDGELDILYLAVWTPADEDNSRYSSCPRVLAIQAKNGEYLWELAAAASPVRLCSQHATALVDLVVDGRMRALLIQSLGSSGLNLVDRLTGQVVAVDSQAALGVLPEDTKEDLSAIPANCSVGAGAVELPLSSAMAVDPINKLIFLGLEGTENSCEAVGGDLIAWDPINREARWRVSRADMTAGLLATGGNLLFQAAQSELVAYHSQSGEKRWAYPLESASAPISYQINGRQYIAIVANSTEGRSDQPQLMVFSIAKPITAAAEPQEEG